MSVRYILKSFNKLAVQRILTPNVFIVNNIQSFCSSATTADTIDVSSFKKKTTIIPKITLILPGDNISITTYEEAQKISRRRDLKLVKIIDFDTKTQRPVYRLMTGSEYHAEDLKRRAERKAHKNDGGIKGEKMLTVSTRISEHDLESRIKNILRWVSKNYEVRVVINGDAANMSLAEDIYQKLENSLKSDARLLQKRIKGGDIRFQILPPKREKSGNEKS